LRVVCYTIIVLVPGPPPRMMQSCMKLACMRPHCGRCFCGLAGIQHAFATTADCFVQG
jgi:hypothetical protein